MADNALTTEKGFVVRRENERIVSLTKNGITIEVQSSYRPCGHRFKPLTMDFKVVELRLPDEDHPSLDVVKVEIVDPHRPNASMTTWVKFSELEPAKK